MGGNSKMKMTKKKIEGRRRRRSRRRRRIRKRRRGRRQRPEQTQPALSHSTCAKIRQATHSLEDIHSLLEVAALDTRVQHAAIRHGVGQPPLLLFRKATEAMRLGLGQMFLKLTF